LQKVTPLRKTHRQLAEGGNIMTSNSQPNTQQKNQPDIRAQNPDAKRQFGQEGKPGNNPQNKTEYNQPKHSARPEDDEDEEKRGPGGSSKDDNNMNSGDQYKKSAAQKY
jgi:hypothetical protein